MSLCYTVFGVVSRHSYSIIIPHKLTQTTEEIVSVDFEKDELLYLLCELID